jgi:hypothetical protein
LEGADGLAHFRRRGVVLQLDPQQRHIGICFILLDRTYLVHLPAHILVLGF